MVVIQRRALAGCQQTPSPNVTPMANHMLASTYRSFELGRVGRLVLGAERRYLDAPGDGSHPIRRQVGRPDRLGEAAIGDESRALGYVRTKATMAAGPAAWRRPPGQPACLHRTRTEPAQPRPRLITAY